MKVKIIGIFFVIMLLLSISCTGSGGTATTTSINTTTTTGIPGSPSPQELAAQNFVLPELPRITGEQLKQRIDNGEPLVVVDTRLEFFFNMGHLPQAIDIPYQLEDEQTASFLALPKDKPVIFYCD